MLRLPLSLLSPAGKRGRLSILIFHRVLPRPDPLSPDEPDAAEFEAQMRWVRSWFNVLPLGTAIDRLYAGTIPPRALAITFDDGYADNEELAAPILARLGMTATFFISTGYLGGGIMWNDRVIEAVRACEGDTLDVSAAGLGRHPVGSAGQRRAAIAALLKAIKHFEQPQRDAATDAIVAAAGGRPSPALMMQPEQVRRLRTLGMDIGAHTVSHPILTRLDAQQARDEMASGKRALEQLLGEPVELFAYPNGVPGQDYAAEHVAMAQACGFRAAVSTAWGAASAQSDRFQLPRFTPWDRARWLYGARLLGNLRRPDRSVVPA
ncbi:polysaccharide deacetylase family protein [Piscinibacter sp. XHJ-5]|uniref:polysaccharide deacetylase family protein n=1 Tax=Piscinibacter sp. XHJ-5 TaxID=3037797 RepID=UPI002452B331|nr:polysaccharide deacetylase family protein [Piscinibacter sp. XHJ-5]